MAKIYISYSHADKQIVYSLAEKLRDRGHELIMDTEVMKAGVDFRKTLLSALKSSDGVLTLITENSLKSNYVLSEIGAARAFIDESSNKKFLLPVIYGDIDIPNILLDIYCIRLNEHNYSESIELIDESISSFLGRKEAIVENQETERKKIETTASDYIEIAIESLEKREKTNSLLGKSWYIIGFTTLLIGICFSIYSITNLNSLKNAIYWLYIVAVLKSIIIIGLIIACSKYAFNLGKTYTNESLRNADRIHAISFGKFYLQAFGDRISSAEEIKEIFQNWNIDKESAFQKLDPNSYDPKLTENIIEVLKNLSEATKK